MNFTEALRMIQEGRKMCRPSWDNDGAYLVAMPGMSHIWKILTKPNPNCGNHIFSLEEFNAEDWQEFELKSSVIHDGAIQPA